MKKHTTKVITLLLTIICAVCLAVGLVGCNSNTGSGHQHTFKSGWEHDETNHWHEADCEHTNLTDGLAAHNYGTDNVCDDCGYVQTEAGHVHTFAKTWEYDETNHWHVATCGHTNLTDSLATHNYGTDNVCDDCGYVQTAGGHTHTFKKTWEYNETNHWHEADCGHTNLTEGLAEHEYDNGNTCLTCGYTLPVGHTHELSDELDHDNTYHWYPALCNHNVKGNLEKHNFNSGNECDDCGYVFTPTEDELEAYDLYKAHVAILGGEELTIIRWKEYLVEQGIDLIEILPNGDVRVYRGLEDENGSILYVSERTVAVSAVLADAAYADLWFKVVAVSGDNEIVLGAGKTDAEGVATITFLPVLGYSGDGVNYIVTFATADDLDEGDREDFAPLAAYAILNSAEELTFSVSSDDRKVELEFTFTAGLGIGHGVDINVVGRGTFKTILLASDITEGLYELTWNVGNSQQVGSTVEVDNGAIYQFYADGGMKCLIYIPQGAKSITVKNGNPSGSGSANAKEGTLVIVDASDHTFVLDKGYYSVSTNNNSTQPFSYKIDKSVEPGIYKAFFTLASGSGFGTNVSTLNAYIGDRTYSFLGGNANSVSTTGVRSYSGFFKIEEGDTEISFVLQGSTAHNVSIYTDGFNTIPDENVLELGTAVTGTASISGSSGYWFTAPKDATYIINLTRTSGSSNLSSCGKVDELYTGKTLTTLSSSTTNIQWAFTAAEGEKLAFHFYSNSSVTSIAVSFTLTMHLDAPVITLMDGTISWEEVDNATGYNVYGATSNSATASWTKINQELITGTSYTISDVKTSAYYYTVTAVDGSDDATFGESIKSNAVGYPVTLETPVITLHAGLITWEPVIGATGYKIYNGTSSSATAEVETVGKDQLYWVITETATTKYFRIKAINASAPGYTAESGYSNSVQYYAAFATPVITIDGNTVTWDAVAYASGYEVNVTGSVFDEGGNSSSYAGLTVNLGKVTSYTLPMDQPGSYTIKVKALAGESLHFKDSAYSTAKSYYITTQFATPELRIDKEDGFKLRWEDVPNANRYYYTINGYSDYTTYTYLDLSFGINSTFYRYLVVGENTFTVYASSSTASVSAIFKDSKVATITYNIEAQQLATPEVSFDPETMLISWNAVPNATNYNVYYNDDLLTSLLDTGVSVIKDKISDYNWGLGRYSITVVAYNKYNNAIYPDSQPSVAIEHTVVARTLATPEVSFEDYVVGSSYNLRLVKWTKDTSANVCYVYINGVKVYEGSYTQLDLTDELFESNEVPVAETYSFVVKVANTTYPEKFYESENSIAAVLTPERLSTPVVTMGSNNYSYSFSKVTLGESRIYATEYKVYVNGTLLTTIAGSTYDSYNISFTNEYGKSLPDANEQGNFVITVVAAYPACSRFILNSEASEPLTTVPHKLQTPVIALDSTGYGITWSKVGYIEGETTETFSGAMYYNIYVNDTFVERPFGSNISSWTWNDSLVEAAGVTTNEQGKYVLTITAFWHYCPKLYTESDMSNTIELTPSKINASIEITLNSSKDGATWTAIPGVSQYSIYIDGVLQATTTSASWKLTTTIKGKLRPGEHALYITASHTAGKLFTDSDPSNTVNIEVESLDAAKHNVRVNAAADIGWTWTYAMQFGLFEKDNLNGDPVGTVTVNRYNASAAYGFGTVTAPNDKVYVWKVLNADGMPAGFTISDSAEDAVWSASSSSTPNVVFTITKVETAAASVLSVVHALAMPETVAELPVVVVDNKHTAA